jgi:phospholipase C
VAFAVRDMQENRSFDHYFGTLSACGHYRPERAVRRSVADHQCGERVASVVGDGSIAIRLAHDYFA